ncbi:hypothetical protein ACWFRJ_30910 [Streptomyces sp. NPDC055239]
MTQQEIAALAMTGATTIVAAMATDAWTTVRSGFSAFIRRRSPDLHAGIEARLDNGAALVAQAGDAKSARGVLVGLWQGELERFLAAHPDAAEELGVQTAEMLAALPTMQQQWVQHNAAHDHGVVNAVQDGTQHNHYMDSLGTQPPSPGA